MPGGQRWAIPVSTTVPAATGPKSQATGPEVLLMLPLEGEAALPLPLGKTVNAAINPPTRIRREITAQLDRTAIVYTPCDLFRAVGNQQRSVVRQLGGPRQEMKMLTGEYSSGMDAPPPSGQVSAKLLAVEFVAPSGVCFRQLGALVQSAV
jgi:hypothetical protein